MSNSIVASPKQPPSSPQASALNLSSLSDEFRTNMFTLEKHIKSFRQQNKNEADTTKFFENVNIRSILLQTDKLIRTNAVSKVHMSRLRDFCMCYLANAFEMSRDAFQKRFEHVVFQMKAKESDRLLGVKLAELKTHVDTEMRKALDKYTATYEQYLRQRAIAGGQADVLIQPPKKNFDWTVKMRELLHETARLKLNTFRSSQVATTSGLDAQQLEAIKSREREKFLRDFFAEKLVVLWPEGWMNAGVLWTKYESCRLSRDGQRPTMNRSSASASTLSVGNSQNDPRSPANSVANRSGVINISSKNGKPIRIEAQNLNQSAGRQLSSFFFLKS